MLINNEKLSVSPITTHINIREVPNKINKLVIIKKVNLINTWFKNYIKKTLYWYIRFKSHNAELKNNPEEKNNYACYKKI